MHEPLFDSTNLPVGRLVGGGAMTLRTGTSCKVDKYSTCSTCARQGKTACRGRSVPMDKLDSIVVEALAERLFQPERLRGILDRLRAQARRPRRGTL